MCIQSDMIFINAKDFIEMRLKNDYIDSHIGDVLNCRHGKNVNRIDVVP